MKENLDLKLKVDEAYKEANKLFFENEVSNDWMFYHDWMVRPIDIQKKIWRIKSYLYNRYIMVL